MRFLLAVGLLVLSVPAGTAAPVPKGQTKNAWVGKPAFVKTRDVKLTAKAADGSERKDTFQSTYFYVVTKVTDDRVETNLPFATTNPVTYTFRRDDVLPAAEAIAFYTAKLKDNPKDAYTYAYRGWANHVEDKTDAAVADFTRAIELEPDDTFFRRYRSTVLMQAKKYAAAIEDYDYLINHSPTYEWAIRQRASAKASLQRFDEAIAEYTKLLDTTANRDGVLIGRGLVYDHSGQHDKALADYDAVLKIDPKSAVAWNNKGWLRATCPDAKFRDGEAAVEFATKACELTEWANAGYLDTLAAAYAEQGDFEKATKWQREAMHDKELLKRDEADITARLELYKQKKPYRQPTVEKK